MKSLLVGIGVSYLVVYLPLLIQHLIGSYFLGEGLLDLYYARWRSARLNNSKSQAANSSFNVPTRGQGG